MSTKIGYDGNKPEFREKRGSEVRDPLTGEVQRQGEMSAQNVACDSVEWLLAHKRIQPHHHAAARVLEQDAKDAARITYALMGGVRGGTGTNLPSDFRCDAIERKNAAREYLGGELSRGWRIVELVVLENKTLGKAEGMMRMGAGNGIGSLTTALDCLARHYGLA